MQETDGIKCLIVGGGGGDREPKPFKSEISAHRSRRERHAMKMAPSSLILPPLFVLARTKSVYR